jgi:hypothetical protein
MLCLLFPLGAFSYRALAQVKQGAQDAKVASQSGDDDPRLQE